jgi:hypothetical protein
MTLRIDINREEIMGLVSLLDFVGDDLETPAGYVALKSDGKIRTWSATNGVTAVSITCGIETAEYWVLLSPSQFGFLVATAHSDDAPVLELHDDGTLYLGSTHASMKAPSRRQPRLFFDYDVDAIEFAAFGEFRVRDLLLQLDALLLERKHDVESTTIVEIGLSEGHINFSRDVPGLGYFESRLAGRGVSGDVMVTLDLQRLRETLAIFSPESDIRVSMPRFQGAPVVARHGGITASLMPWKSEFVLAREHVEVLIEEVFGHLALSRDSDGDYPLRRHGNLIYGRLSDSATPVAFQAFGVLLRDVDPSPELLFEINQINSKVPFAKLLHIENQLIVESDLVASSMDALELETAVSKISRAMDDYSATLSVVFGGDKDEEPMAARWSRYRNTIIHAEVTPGNLCHLNGPEAIVSWPFPADVHVISGWNPQGVAFDGGYINSQIAADVIQRGASFVMCAGVSRDGSYSEPSLAIWGLTREVAREIGRKANQDAIFEIVDEEVRILSCFTDHTETLLRHEGPAPSPELGYL